MQVLQDKIYRLYLVCQCCTVVLHRDVEVRNVQVDRGVHLDAVVTELLCFKCVSELPLTRPIEDRDEGACPDPPPSIKSLPCTVYSAGSHVHMQDIPQVSQPTVPCRHVCSWTLVLKQAAVLHHFHHGIGQPLVIILQIHGNTFSAILQFSLFIAGSDSEGEPRVEVDNVPPVYLPCLSVYPTIRAFPSSTLQTLPPTHPHSRYSPQGLISL